MRASRATVRARTAAMVRLMLAGHTERRDLRAITSREAEQEGSLWRDCDGRPISLGTLKRYMALATAEIKGRRDRDIDRVIARHVIQRIEAYELALADDDPRGAVAILDSLARIEGVTPEGQLAAAVDRARDLEERLNGGSATAAGGRILGAVPPANGNGSGGH